MNRQLLLAAALTALALSGCKEVPDSRPRFEAHADCDGGCVRWRLSCRNSELDCTAVLDAGVSGVGPVTCRAGGTCEGVSMPHNPVH